MPEQTTEPWAEGVSNDLVGEGPQDLVSHPTHQVRMGGNEGGNAGISEFISLVLEPVAREQSGNMEINATNGLLADITDYNEELRREREETSQLEEVQVQ